MKNLEVFVNEKDKDFIDACLSETNCYLYIQDELQGEILKLKSLDQHDAEVRKHVIAELEEWEKKCPKVEEWDNVYNVTRTYIHKEDLQQKLNEMKGEKQL